MTLNLKPRMLALLIPLSAFAAGTDSLQALKAEAFSLFGHQRFPQACRKYGQAIALDPGDGGLRADLGICLQRLGKKDSAALLSREALGLSGQSLAAALPSLWSALDARSRKSAYATLEKLGKSLPAPEPGSCLEWAAPAGCDQPLHVCAAAGAAPQSHGQIHWKVLRVSAAKGKAFFTSEDLENPAEVPHPAPQILEGIAGESGGGAWPQRVEAADFTVAETRDPADCGCPTLGWKCDASPALLKQAQAACPADTGDDLAESDCFQAKCSEARSKPSKDIAAEQKAGAGRVAACARTCPKREQGLLECRVLHGDACSGFVGAVCSAREGTRSRNQIVEYYLAPAGGGDVMKAFREEQE